MVITLESEQGLIDVVEGDHDITASGFITTTGFSYGAIPLYVLFLNYSGYESLGFNLRNEFESPVIPANSADGKLPIVVVIENSRLLHSPEWLPLERSNHLVWIWTSWLITMIRDQGV